MKSMTLAAMVLFTSLALTAQSNTHIVMHQDGLFATASGFSSGTSFFVEVSRATDFNGQATTFLSFDSFSDTADGFTDSFAFGTIPDGSIQGSDAAHIALDVDLTQLTTFSGFTCTFSFITFTETCAAMPLGPVHLQWRQTRFFNQQTITEDNDTFFQGRIIRHQSSDNASANVSGSLLGLDLSNGGGVVGINHGSTMDLFKF